MRGLWLHWEFCPCPDNEVARRWVSVDGWFCPGCWIYDGSVEFQSSPWLREGIHISKSSCKNWMVFSPSADSGRLTSRRMDLRDLSSISATFWFSSSFWRSPTSCFTALMLADVASSLNYSFLPTSACCAISPLSLFAADLEASIKAFGA